MKELAGKLNIKGHLCGTRNQAMMYAPADIEVHAGSDGRFYVLDFARQESNQILFLMFITNIFADLCQRKSKAKELGINHFTSFSDQSL